MLATGAAGHRARRCHAASQHHQQRTSELHGDEQEEAHCARIGSEHGGRCRQERSPRPAQPDELVEWHIFRVVLVRVDCTWAGAHTRAGTPTPARAPTSRLQRVWVDSVRRSHMRLVGTMRPLTLAQEPHVLAEARNAEQQQHDGGAQCRPEHAVGDYGAWVRQALDDGARGTGGRRGGA